MSNPGDSAIRPVQAPFGARLAALLLDLAVGFGMAVVSVLVAWLWLLWRSDGGVQQPSDGAIYLALALGTLWLPAWATVTLVGWTRNGRSPGLAAMALRIAVTSGGPPSPIRSLVRLLILAVAAASLVLLPIAFVGVGAAAAQGTLPWPVAIGTGVLALPAVAEALCCMLVRDRRALHDLAAGTRVVRSR